MRTKGDVIPGSPKLPGTVASVEVGGDGNEIPGASGEWPNNLNHEALSRDPEVSEQEGCHFGSEQFSGELDAYVHWGLPTGDFHLTNPDID